MRRQVSAPAHESRRPSDTPPNVLERPASATSRPPPGVPRRPSVPPPNSNRSARNYSPYYTDENGTKVLIGEQEKSLEFLVSEINKKQIEVNRLRSEVSNLELEIAKEMPTMNRAKANAIQVDEMCRLWANQRSLAIDCQYWTLSVDSFGDHYLGDVNCTRSVSRPASTAPPLPQKPSPQSISNMRRAPISELDRRVPLPKDRGPTAPY